MCTVTCSADGFTQGLAYVGCYTTGAVLQQHAQLHKTPRMFLPMCIMCGAMYNLCTCLYSTSLHASEHQRQPFEDGSSPDQALAAGHRTVTFCVPLVPTNSKSHHTTKCMLRSRILRDTQRGCSLLQGGYPAIALSIHTKMMCRYPKKNMFRPVPGLCTQSDAS